MGWSIITGYWLATEVRVSNSANDHPPLHHRDTSAPLLLKSRKLLSSSLSSRPSCPLAFKKKNVQVPLWCHSKETQQLQPVAVTFFGSDEQLHSVVFHWKDHRGEAFCRSMNERQQRWRCQTFSVGDVFLVNQHSLFIHLNGKEMENPCNYIWDPECASALGATANFSSVDGENSWRAASAHNAFFPHFYSNGALKDLWRNMEKKQNKKIITLVGAAWDLWITWTLPKSWLKRRIKGEIQYSAEREVIH